MSQQEIDSLALRRIAAGVEPGQAWSSYQAAARALDRIPAGAVPDRLRARVALLGSFTLEPFVPVLRVEAARAGIWLDIYVAPYGQYLSELIDPTSGLYRFRPTGHVPRGRPGRTVEPAVGGVAAAQDRAGGGRTPHAAVLGIGRLRPGRHRDRGHERLRAASPQHRRGQRLPQQGHLRPHGGARQQASAAAARRSATTRFSFPWRMSWRRWAAITPSTGAPTTAVM